MIKKICIILLLTTISFLSKSQNESDALMFSYFTPVSTARYTAMGGAFSALGGDMSTMGTNPAGTGLYRKNDVGLSMVWNNRATITEYYNNINKVYDNSFQLANMGFLTSNLTGNISGWKTINFGFSYNNLNNYNRSFSVSGNNYTSSLLDFHTDYLNNNPNDYNENAYYQAEIVFWDSLSNRYYNDYNYNGGNYYGALQTHDVQTDGYAGEYSFNLSSNYNDFLYLGVTIGVPHISYFSTVKHTEHPFNDTIALKHFTSYDYLDASGTGINLKLGVLFKINQTFRVGLAFHTPTAFNMKYYYWTDVYGTINLGDGAFSTIGKTPHSNFEWGLHTPAKYILSGSAVIGKKGIISGEVEYCNYSKLNIDSYNNSFEYENNNIKKIYKETFNAKIGAEYRLWILGLRGGFYYFDSPYNITESNKNAYTIGYSCGIGTNISGIFIDFAYTYMKNKEYYYMYGYSDSKVAIENRSNRFVLTTGYKF
jgi:hypothetical protein